ncbi:uncharacterized protein [Choristoneura fumiferana]
MSSLLCTKLSENKLLLNQRATSLASSVCTFHQEGPDPWHYKNDASLLEKENIDVTPDLRMPLPPKRNFQSQNAGIGDWFFKRILAIVLKGGQFKKNEDSSVDVSVQMRFDESQWATLNEYLAPNVALSEEMFRRSVGYIENAIYQPSITERIAIAWHDHIQFYIMEYKMQITMTLGILAAVGALLWLWNHMSHKHFKIILFAALYLYEVVVSYKEADQKEFERYMSAINTCKWFFWSSDCEVPPPDPTVFLKHMNPLKIVLRMFTTIVSEPMITISATMQTIIHGITDGMWFPLDKIMHGVLTISFTLILVVLLVMIVFTYLLNIPFSLSFLAGLVSVGVNENRSRSFIPSNRNNQASTDNGDRISGATLDRLLEVCSRALSSAQNSSPNFLQGSVGKPMPIQISNENRPTTSLKRSASAGRLQDYKSHGNKEFTLDNSIRNRNKTKSRSPNGGGDAF